MVRAEQRLFESILGQSPLLFVSRYPQSTDLHTKIMAEKEQLELNTLAEYVERIFTEHFEGGQISMKAERTLAVQIPAELFERLKEYLAARNLKQKQFLIQLIENALDDTEAE